MSFRTSCMSLFFPTIKSLRAHSDCICLCILTFKKQDDPSPHPHLVDALGKEEVQARFVAEAKAMAALRHPNLLEILDFDFDDGRPFFTMEYYYQNLGMLIGEGSRVERPTRLLSLD